MDGENKKLSLLNEELDEESAQYLNESIQSWKEDMMAKFQEEVEEAKQSMIEELEEANLAYREELKEEYSEKLMSALSDLKESVKAEATASVLRNNPEIKILEEIKKLVAPLLNEDYVEESYSNTIAVLSEENEALRREQELNEGAQTLAELLAPYGDTTRNFVLSLIKEGNAEEVTEQFYTIMENLNGVFGEAESEDDSDDDENEDEDEKSKKDDKDEEGDEDDEDSDDDDEVTEESYIDEDYEGDEDELEESYNSFANEMRNLAKF